jgi:hypothetical protein
MATYTIFMRRVSDPSETIAVTFEDMGDTLASWRADRTVFWPHTSVFTVDGLTVYSLFDPEGVSLADLQKARFEHDVAVLRTVDADLRDCRE